MPVSSRRDRDATKRGPQRTESAFGGGQTKSVKEDESETGVGCYGIDRRNNLKENIGTVSVTAQSICHEHL